jgi:putative FmdB family regulatory protein
VPLYEYQCAQCGRFELIQKFSDEPLRACPTCGKEVQKLLSSPAIQFKGSGWYITDYARKGKSGGGAEGSKNGNTESGASSEGKSDSGKDAGKSESSTSSKAESKSDSTPTNSPSK